MKSRVSTAERHLYTPMARVPLVPESVLHRHNVHFTIDTLPPCRSIASVSLAQRAGHPDWRSRAGSSR